VQAAKALEPLVQVFPNSGYLAKFLFALGIIGTGLLAVPIFAASSAYAISEVFGWKEGLSNKVKRAKPFYLVILISTLIGLLINYIGINSIRALVYAATLNGVVSIPLIAMILNMANNKKIMGEHVTPRYINILGHFALVVIISVVLGAIVTYFIK
jgi:Mn2+/Fe2+ NRAMP family transporter